MAGLYFHIPFCKQACHYCDFHFSTNLSLKTKLITCMVRELEMQRDYLGPVKLQTLYLGGGTPSLLDENELGTLLNAVHKHFSLAANPEITLEANPDDITPFTLQSFKSVGINRLSVGIQSFHDSILQYMNRAHSALRANQAIDCIREAGFSNVSIDLIFAVPGQTEAMWISDIEDALKINPEHISCYSLTIEEKTVFGHWHKKGQLEPVDEKIAARFLLTLSDRLTESGFEHYEVSNFSRPGFQARHNSHYWAGKHYLGIGPAAHSYNTDSRQFNIANNHAYVNSLNAGIVPAEKEVLSRENKINEYLLTRLRTAAGADIHFLKNNFDYDLMRLHSDYVDRLQQQSLAILDGEYLKLTRKGFLLADTISSELFVTS
jgi:oxygen-independent coproporphyrinogen-3 oxidase